MFTDNCDHELAHQVERLAADPQLQARLLRNAASFLEENSLERVGGLVLQVYQQLLGRPAAAEAPRTPRLRKAS
jgi:hypothetical protein